LEVTLLAMPWIASSIPTHISRIDFHASKSRDPVVFN
jgi:hypothetical protein